MANRWGNSVNSGRLYFLGSKITADGDCSHEIKRHLLLGRKVMINLDSTLKSRDITLLTKVHLVKAMVFPVVIYGCESWTIRCFRTVVLEKTLESPLDSKEIQPVHPKGNQSWMFIGRTDAEAETAILWLPDAKIWLIWKDSDARKDWRQEEERTEDEMASPTRWTWVWVNSRIWWWTGRLDVLQSMVSQRVGHDWWTKLDWTSLWPKNWHLFGSIISPQTPEHLAPSLMAHMHLGRIESWSLLRSQWQSTPVFLLGKFHRGIPIPQDKEDGKV